MKFFNLIARPLILLLLVNHIQCAFSQETGKLVILHTNDLHSRLDGYAPSLEYTPLITGDDNTEGGFSRLAAIINRERAENPDNTLVLDAGDFLMGTIFHYMEEYKPFQLPLMKEMGYDAVALGNHEFDYGPERIAHIISNSRAVADIPQLLLGNVDFDNKDSGDDSFQDLFNKDIIKRRIILEKGGFKTGVFSLLGEDADEVAPFAAPLSFDKNIRTARKISKELKAEGCDLIICLSHSGLEKDDDGQWTGEDVKLAEKVDDIDIIISGHTHSMLDDPLIINNTVIVQTGSYGRYIGKLEISMDKGTVGLIDYSLIPVDDNVRGDAAVQTRIDYQKELISGKLYSITGYRVDDSIVSTGFELTCDEYGNLEQSNLGPLVADAIYGYVNSGTDEGTDIAMVAAGVIRDRVEPGIQTTQDIFRVMSLGSGRDDVPGYPLARVYVSGKELKRVLEILLVAWKSTPSNYCYYSGLEVKYDPDRGLLRKISSISIKNGNGEMIPVDLSRNNDALYSIAANSYMLEFIGIIQKMTFGLIRVKPKDINGNEISDMSTAVIDFDSKAPGVQEGKEWLALLNYLSSMKDVDNNGIPDLDPKYENPGLALIPVK
ncbi:MAG: bifunctional UDP-sugar hydrolase/5'-nucleotidase [Bacteroidales bacterium]|nr:bifunctional UDP-sugar hydrolase/5'-nucleotidase [Bacteroidales bacterium]